MSEEKYEIFIKADYNDADYVSSTHKMSEEEIDLIKPLVAAIKANGGDWPAHEYASGDNDIRVKYKEFSEEAIDLFNDICPCGEYGIHSIESVEYYPLPVKVTLL